VRNLSAYTRFSTSGGGQLPGYDTSTECNERYLVQQLGLETLLKYREFSLTSENHVKFIDDNETGTESLIYGGFIMSGFFRVSLSVLCPIPWRWSFAFPW